MKKNYEKPTVEVVKFQYRDQVVAASGYCKCGFSHTDATGETCEDTKYDFWGSSLKP